MRIGEAARRLGVAVHVLRHWDAEGVVVPDRTPAGHREYTEEHLHRMRVLRACQEVGLSLAEVRLVLHRDEASRASVIEHHLARIRRQRAHLDATETFLAHVVACEHDLLTRCPACSAYAVTSPAGPSRAT
ncbi:MerR family transcriptional regulator [Pseudonocardia ammonioxydans]|nr:MerR family transcriptional regulator [Pseudonocardia ammonioxydans]